MESERKHKVGFLMAVSGFLLMIVSGFFYSLVSLGAATGTLFVLIGFALFLVGAEFAMSNREEDTDW
ncbi:MAG: hypothetical protein ABEJ03_02935 [Candidatus Nanohaloarchaea archaeon]